MVLQDAVALGFMPKSSRGEDVRCLCVDIEVQDQSPGLLKGYKFSRALVNSGMAPEYVKKDRNLQQERFEIEFKAEDSELLPLTVGQLHVLRCFPSLLWRLEFVALMKELPNVCNNLLASADPSDLAEALTHSQVLSLPLELPSRRFCLERLELLGDAVLKLLATVQCSAALPTADEDRCFAPGDSKRYGLEFCVGENRLSTAAEFHKHAQFFETNKWLRHVCKQTLGLSSCIVLQPFRPKRLLAELRRDTAPQKVVADAMEAVLGAAFRRASSLTLGVDAAWKIFSVLLKHSPPAQKAACILEAPFIENFKELYQDALLATVGDVHLGDAEHFVLEGRRSRAFERLEFLGDAVLQVVVSWHVMREFQNFDEGELSDTQQAFVCNQYISRKFVRRCGEACLVSVFFPGTTSPLRTPLMKYFESVKSMQEPRESNDFIVGEKSDISAVPGANPSQLKCVADTYEPSEARRCNARAQRVALREKRRSGERRSMAVVARRLHAVMEERGSLTIVPEEAEEDLGGSLLVRARALSLSAVHSFAAVAAWAVTPDAASTASGHTERTSLPRSRSSTEESLSDSARVNSPGSFGSFSSNSDSAVGFLGEALLRAEAASQAARAGGADAWCDPVGTFTMGIA
eukprot:g3442.t1